MCHACGGTGDRWISACVLTQQRELLNGLNALARSIHADNVLAGWWNDLGTGQDIRAARNRPEMLMLMVSELSEASEAVMHQLQDDKLPHRPGFDVELADTCIRALDLLGAEATLSGQSPIVQTTTIDGTSVTNTVRDMREEMNHRYYRSIDDRLMQVVNDLSRAMEAYRRSLTITGRFYVTQALLRCIAVASHHDVPLFDVIEEKRNFNRQRADHKVANRKAHGGKQF